MPGSHFDLPHHLRLGFGPPEKQLHDGLARLAAVVDPLREASTATHRGEVGS